MLDRSTHEANAIMHYKASVATRPSKHQKQAQTAPSGAAQTELGLAERPPPQIDGVLEGEVVRVTYENEHTGFRVLRVKVAGELQPQTVVGVFPPAPPGARVRATGDHIEDGRHGPQFKAETLITLAPATLDGLKRYLASGLVPGIGPAYAKRIVDAFGEQTLEVLDRSPHRLREIPGLGRQRVTSVAKAWADHREIGAIMVFLQAHGASPALATRIYKRFGREAMNIVSRSPYRLAIDVWGVGFKTADAMARSIGIDIDSPERAQAGLLQTLHDCTNQGHVYTESEELIARSEALLESESAPVREALETLERSGHIRRESLLSGETAIYTPDLHDAEQRVATRLQRLLRHSQTIDHADRAIADFERRTGLELAPAQGEAIQQAAQSKVLVITGGPGVGKTTIVLALLALYDSARIPVHLAAPTGRAAKRMAEATGREAATIHRLLEYEPRSQGFQRGAEKPLRTGAVVIDESSMIDLPLADALLQAIDDDTRIVFVGDVDQLPSVGPGAVLRDIIASERTPTVRLNQVFRQAEGSSIIVNAHRIHDGEPPIGSREKDEQFYVIERHHPDDAIETIRELMSRRIPKSFGLDPQRDVQLLTPMQRGSTGAIALNALLQNDLNPTGPEVKKGSRVLRLGDKVMQLKNDYDKEVFNGDVGRISQVDPEARQLTVRFDERDVNYAEGDLDKLSLAYATSIHKSQGSEYPAVIITMLTQHFVMLSRNLLYTAVTRGKKLVVLVADPRALSMALAELRKEDRRTQLAQRIATS